MRYILRSSHFTMYENHSKNRLKDICDLNAAFLWFYADAIFISTTINYRNDSIYIMVLVYLGYGLPIKKWYFRLHFIVPR